MKSPENASNETTSIRYCRMCRWYSNPLLFTMTNDYSFAHCYHPKHLTVITTPVDIISGKTKTTVIDFAYCKNERKLGTGWCGPGGENFAPRRKWWKLWLA